MFDEFRTSANAGPNFSRNLSSYAARLLGERILCGVYHPGQVLPGDEALSQDLDVSKTAVRDGIRILASKGMVTTRQRVGTVVLDKNAWQLLDRDVLAWQQNVPINPGLLRQLMEIRQTVEPVAARLAARRRSDGDMQAIGTALAQMRAAIANGSDFAVADAGFHSAVLRAARNQYFDALEGVIFAGLLISVRVTNPQEQENSVSYPPHERVGSAIAARDEEAAFNAMHDLLQDAETRLEAALAGLFPAAD